MPPTRTQGESMNKSTEKYKKQKALDLTWTTKKECEYLKRIGNNHIQVRNRTSQRTLLEKYIIAAKMRFNWGDMDGDEVINCAETLLKNCKA